MNSAAPLLAYELGGELLLGLISAVAFATILAVVAGLTITASTSFAHDVYGQVIKKGQAVMAVMAAGNRDPRRFTDPDTLDLRRTDNRHLAFGWAAHFCFGAPLARMEGRIAFKALLSRLPDLALRTVHH